MEEVTLLPVESVAEEAQEEAELQTRVAVAETAVAMEARAL